jgi:polyhydroxybutyrate depolymerase
MTGRAKVRFPSGPNAAALQALLLATWLPVATASPGKPASAVESPALQPVTLQVQGLHRTVRIHRPPALAAEPALVLLLHGSGGTGERFRRFTDGGFDRLAREHGWIVAYPDALGGQWHDCRGEAPYREALNGIDDVGFLNAVAKYVADDLGRPLAATFVVGYSNGGHMAFRLALEAPERFAAFAAIGAHLPTMDELVCCESARPVSMLLVSGTEDPINPWSGGTVHGPDSVRLGSVRSAEGTVSYFRTLAGLDEALPDVRQFDAADDGTFVTARRWNGTVAGVVVAQLAVTGGGHSLPQPTGRFPESVTGPTSRDMDGAGFIWQFFVRHLGT